MPSDDPRRTARGSGGKTRRLAFHLFRILFRIAIPLLASLVVLYVFAINVFLSTSLFARVVNASPDTIDIHFQHAWSIVPPHIHARKLSIRGRDSNVEWILRLDEVEFDVSLSSLLKQRFQASNVHGAGLSFRLRRRLEAAPRSPEEVATLPPIEGLPPYSIRPPQTPWPGLWNDAYYDLWSAHLEGIVAKDVREVWIDHARFEGHARINGRFYLKPNRAIEVGPVHVSVAQGGVYAGERPVAEGLDGTVLDATLASFDPRTAGGPDILHRLSLEGDAAGVLPDLGGLLPTPEGMTIRGGAAVRRAVLHIRSGVVAPDSHLEASAPNMVLTSATHRTTAGLAFEANVVPASAGGDGRLTFRAEMANVEVSRALSVQGARSVLLGAPRVVATGDSAALDLARPFKDLHVVLDLPEGDVPNARALSRYIPPKTPVSLVNGRARAEARVEVWLAEKRATGRGTLHAEDLDIALAKMRVRGRTSVQAGFASYHFDTRRIDGATLRMHVASGSLASAAAPDMPLVRMRGARLAAHAAIADLADPLRALDVTISLPSADVVTGGLLHAYLPKGAQMQIASGHSRFSLDFKLVVAEHRARGSLDLRSRELTLVYRDLRLDTGVRARARVHDWHWEAGGELALDEAKVGVENLTISKTGSGVGSAAPAMAIARIAVEATSPRFAFEDPLARIALSASLLDAKVHDSSAINAFLPEKATFELETDEGSFGAQIDVEVEDHTARGTVRARAKRMGAGNGTAHLRGDVDLSADFVDWNFKQNTMNLLNAQVAMAHVDGRFRAQGPPQLSLERVALSEHAPKFDLAHPTLKGTDLHLVVEGGELPEARALVPLMPVDGVVRIESGTAHVAADVTVSASQRTATGGIDIALVSAAARVEEAGLSGDFRVRARLSGFDPERELLDLSGSRLEMRDVAVVGGSARTSQWRGDATLSRASLRLGPEPLFDGVVTLDARDARPLLSIILGSRLPGIVVRLTDVPHLTASVQIIATSHQLALLDLDAHGGDVGVRGSYAESGPRRRGAVIARKAFLSVGLRRDAGGMRVRLFGLERWLRDQSREVRKVLDVPRGR